MFHFLVAVSAAVPEGPKNCGEQNEKLEDVGASEMARDHENTVHDDASKVDDQDGETCNP